MLLTVPNNVALNSNAKRAWQGKKKMRRIERGQGKSVYTDQRGSDTLAREWGH